MESGAKGCEVVVSGKLRGQRAKSMKFVDGLMIHSGDPVNYYVDTAVRHVLLRQGKSELIGMLCCHFRVEFSAVMNGFAVPTIKPLLEVVGSLLIGNVSHF